MQPHRRAGRQRGRNRKTQIGQNDGVRDCRADFHVELGVTPPVQVEVQTIVVTPDVAGQPQNSTGAGLAVMVVSSVAFKTALEMAVAFHPF